MPDSPHVTPLYRHLQVEPRLLTSSQSWIFHTSFHCDGFCSLLDWRHLLIVRRIGALKR